MNDVVPFVSVSVPSVADQTLDDITAAEAFYNAMCAQFLGRLATSWVLIEAQAYIDSKVRPESRYTIKCSHLDHGRILHLTIVEKGTHMITAKEFTQKTGNPPIHDDLERSNCQEAGKVGHFMCGWCPDCDKPRFVCGHMVCDAKKP